MKILGTDFIMFKVSDLSKATKFYTDILGLECTIYSEEFQWAEFHCGNVTLSLKGKSLDEGRKGAGQIALAVKDINAAYEELQKCGLHMAAPVDHGCCQHIEIEDPDGNIIIVHHRADGTVG